MPHLKDNISRYESIGQGVVMFVCFVKQDGSGGVGEIEGSGKEESGRLNIASAGFCSLTVRVCVCVCVCVWRGSVHVCVCVWVCCCCCDS